MHQSYEYTQQLTNEILSEAATAPPERRKELWDRAIEMNLSLADSVARRYYGRGEHLDDLVQVARVALVKAVHRFEPDRGQFVQFAMPTIAGELKRHFRDHVWVVRPPRRVQELQAQISSAWADLAAEGNATPTTEQIAGYLHARRDDIGAALNAHGCFRPASLDAPQGDSGSAAADLLGDLDPEITHTEDQLVLASAMAQLSEQDRQILRMRFDLEFTQSKIAEELGLNQMAVSRRIVKILDRLRVIMVAEGEESWRDDQERLLRAA